MGKIIKIINSCADDGWVMEPDAKKILSQSGMPVTAGVWAKTRAEIENGVKKVGFPLVIKVVSPEIIHKSDAGGVITKVKTLEESLKIFDDMSSLPSFKGVLLDQMATGQEIIIGTKNDTQFGHIILFGIGGTSVEIYKDVSIRKAPLDESEALSMIKSIKGFKLLDGYRNSPKLNLDSLSRLVSDFSKFVIKYSKHIKSIDLNPVFCDSEKAVIADARIIL